MKIGLISCTKKKSNIRCVAKNMYLPSNLFKKAWGYAKKHYDKTFILSAKHGLLEPNSIIEPYNETLNNKSKKERLLWSTRIFKSLNEFIEIEDEIYFHAGLKYREFLEPLLLKMGIKCFSPLEGLGIGQQLAWYTAFMTNSDKEEG